MKELALILLCAIYILHTSSFIQAQKRYKLDESECKANGGVCVAFSSSCSIHLRSDTSCHPGFRCCKDLATSGDKSKAKPLRKKPRYRKKRCRQVKKCVKRGGKCVGKCPGPKRVKKAKCKGGCLCCALSDSGCSERKKCRNHNGKCVKKCSDGEVEARKGCKGGKKCKCCYRQKEDTGESSDKPSDFCGYLSCPDDEYEPVCGSDGQTYNSACYIQIAACQNKCIQIKSSGQCKRKCGELCNDGGGVVCGSDGKTYSSQCHLDEAACYNPCITTLNPGPCNCSYSALCIDEGGRCQQAVCGKYEKTIKELCPYKDCHCCIPQQTSDCPECLKQGGECQTTCKNGYVGIADLCSNCLCCVPDDSKDCPECLKQGGECQTTCKDGYVGIADLCSNCLCCVPDDSKDCPECLKQSGECQTTCKAGYVGIADLCANCLCCVPDDSKDCPECLKQGGECQTTCKDGYVGIADLCSNCLCCVPDDSKDCPECLKQSGECQTTCKDGYVGIADLCSNCLCCVPDDSKDCKESNECSDQKGTCQKSQCISGYKAINDLCSDDDCHCCVPDVGDKCKDLVCTAVFAPVCGSDGVTYDNLCKLDVAACTNPCITLRDCAPCSYNCGTRCGELAGGRQVCGSDSITYPTMCDLDQAACSNPCIVKKHTGDCDCPPSDTCSTQGGVCQKDPCSTDNKIPGDFCTGDGCLCCIVPFGQPSLPGIPPPPPKSECAAILCPVDIMPVCGSDGLTYTNPCQLQVAICRNPCISLRSCGPCAHECGTPCSSDGEAVCGNNDITYATLCHLDEAACLNPCIAKVKNGPC